jgi:hypothetical protein
MGWKVGDAAFDRKTGRKGIVRGFVGSGQKRKVTITWLPQEAAAHQLTEDELDQLPSVEVTNRSIVQSCECITQHCWVPCARATLHSLC